MTETLNQRARTATKWSLLAEVIARTIAPITQLVLARLLAPEAFGMVATVVMVVSFAEMISDSGFQKYLVQHEFKHQKALYRSANVSFWSSLTLAVVLLGVIALWRDPIAVFVGNPGLGMPLLVAAFSIPLTVVSSTQQALFRRALEYKKVLPIRILSAVVPLVVTVPLAIIGLEHWALIWGIIAGAVFNATAFTVISPWKPSFYYRFSLLRKMLSFSAWTLLESLSIWLTVWSSTFIASALLNLTELGLFRQPATVVTSVFAVVTSATTPILFASLARLQGDRPSFKLFFYRFQFNVALVILPIGVLAFFFRDVITRVALGSQWDDAALMFGLWSFSTSLVIVLSHYYSEAYRALGRPRVSMYSQLIYMAISIPILVWAGNQGFVTFVVAANLVRLVMIASNQIIGWIVVGLKPPDNLKNLLEPLTCSALAGLAAWGLANWADKDLLKTGLGLTAAMMVYLLACTLFPRTRQTLRNAIHIVSTRLRSKSQPNL